MEQENGLDRLSSLADLSPGEQMVVEKILVGETLAARLAALGMIPGTTVACLYDSPSGDPKAYLIRGAAIALRRKDAGAVLGRKEDGTHGFDWIIL